MKGISTGLSISVYVLLLLLVLLTASFSQAIINKQFVDAIDAATNQYVHTPEWKSTLTKAKIPFDSPDCANVPSYPSTFNFSGNHLKFCYDVEAEEPWVSFHETAARLLTMTLNEHYRLNLTYVITKYDTSAGYFSTLNAKVQSGECDVAIAATNHNEERAKICHFQCAYGMSSKSFLRNTYQNETLITDVMQLDNSKYTVVVPTGTTYEAFLLSNFKNAKVVKIPGYDEGWKMILNNTAHAFFGDAFDTMRWLDKNKNACEGCYVKVFGDLQLFGTFTQQPEKVVSLASSQNIISVLVVIISVFFLLNL